MTWLPRVYPDVIDGVVVAVDGVPVCPHDDETRREFVTGRGPRVRCCRCGEVVAGVPEPRALGGRR